MEHRVQGRAWQLPRDWEQVHVEQEFCVMCAKSWWVCECWLSVHLKSEDCEQTDKETIPRPTLLLFTCPRPTYGKYH